MLGELRRGTTSNSCLRMSHHDDEIRVKTLVKYGQDCSSSSTTEVALEFGSFICKVLSEHHLSRR